jgi:hypothetical protein
MAWVNRVPKIARRALAVGLSALAIVYGSDCLWVWYETRHASPGGAFGAVTFYYATPLKNHRVEVFHDQPQTEVCVRSLLPHFGERPCWYAGREPIRLIE